MKRLNLIYLFLSLALLAPSLTGCSDDFDLDDNRQHQIKTGIVLKIPNIRSMASRAQTRADDPLTRAEANAIENEGAIVGDDSARDFWVFIYKTDGTPVEPIQLNAPSSLPSLDASGNPKYYGYNNGTNTYYEISLDPTSYRVYLVANLSEYVSETNWSNISESELKELIMNLGSVISSNKANTILKPGHLPMVCMPTDIDGADPDTGEINVASADVKELKANLVFQCAKIRYTILFDNIPDANGNGFSNAGFGNHLLDFTGATIRNVAAQTCVDDTKDTPDSYLPASGSSFTAALKPVEYPKDGANYVKPNADPDASVSGDRVSDLSPRGDWTATEKKRAWQGVIYVPENKSKDTKTSMTFAGVVDPKTDGTGVNNSYTINLIGPGGNSSTVTSVDPATGSAMGTDSHVTIDRGTFYDLTLLAKKMNAFDINFTVKDWTVEALKYELQGPVFLNVSDTEIPISAGQTSVIKYETNAEDLRFESPKYNNVDLYNFETRNDSILVTVNPRIKTSWFDKITGDEYTKFHIIAGTLYKKIDVSSLILQRFMSVEPLEWTIDAREQLASGNYDGELTVTVRTNVENFNIENVNWDNGNPARSNNLKIYDDNGSEISFGSKTPTNGVYRIKIKYTGLNSGASFWNTKQSLSFKISASNDGINPGPGYIDPKTVTVNIVPANDNYIIHFKADGWQWPHIYIYQCLEFPAYYSHDFEFSGRNYNTAFMAIGYNDGAPTAALEYSFTGKVAFKGWDVSPNKELLQNAPTGYKVMNGFFRFSDGSGEDCSWNASKSTSDTRYFKNYDLCSEHRDRALPQNNCTLCPNSNNPLWPGIIMEKETGENEGWWKFELSSIAVPGKALIMFNNGHGNDGHGRYPADNEVGIPLFDYPSREGWFDLSKKRFTPTKDGNSTITTTTRRIYFTNNNNWSTPYIYAWDANGITGTGNWPGSEMHKGSDGKWYYDIPKNMTKVIFNCGSDNCKTGDITLDSTKDTYNTNGAVGGSSPTPAIPAQTKNYRVIWKKSLRTHIKMSTVNEGGTAINHTGEYNEYYYYDTDTETFNFAFCKSDGSDNYTSGDGAWWIMNNSSWGTYNNKKCFWVDEWNKSGKGIPDGWK